MNDINKPKGMRIPRRAASAEPAGSGSEDTRRSRIHLGGNGPQRPGGVPAKAPMVKPVSTPSVSAPPASSLRRKSLRGTEIVDDGRVSPLAVVEEWGDDETTDTTLGLGAEGDRESEAGLNQRTGAVSKKRVRRFTLNERDVAIIRLLGRFRFGYRTQVERYCDRKDLSRRMTQLANAGFLRNEMVTQTQALWTPTQAGLDVAGLDVPPLSHGKITPTTIGHTVGLLNLGIDLEQGKKDNNILKDPRWPYQYRREMNPDGSYRLETGETIVTERMIVQSYNRAKALYTEHEMKQQLEEALNWKPKAGANTLQMFGPETKEGNEWMFVIFSPSKTHTPDMVLVRPRNDDGSCTHIAIELELTPKSIPEWRRILSSFKGSRMYMTTAYFTHKRTIANSLTALNKQHIGMDPAREFVVLKYIPANRNLPFWG